MPRGSVAGPWLSPEWIRLPRRHPVPLRSPGVGREGARKTPTRQKILVFDDGSLSQLSVEAPRRLRWMAWARDGDSALLAGDHGTLVRFDQDGSRFTRLRSPTSHNLRCVAFAPQDGRAYACGNSGTLLLSPDLEAPRPISEDIRGNLRRLSWSPRGRDGALVVGNDGVAYLLTTHLGLSRIHGADTNLRSIAWHPKGGYALVSGNCFRTSAGGGLAPSPNLFKYEWGDSLIEMQGMAESRADLTAAAWNPDGSDCLIVGFDQTWHTPTFLTFDGEHLSEVGIETDEEKGRQTKGDERPPNRHRHPPQAFPTSCSWHPSGAFALIGTSPMRAGEGTCTLYRYDGRSVRRIFDLGDFGVSCIEWCPDGRAFLIGASSLRAFSV